MLLAAQWVTVIESPNLVCLCCYLYYIPLFYIQTLSDLNIQCIVIYKDGRAEMCALPWHHGSHHFLNGVGREAQTAGWVGCCCLLFVTVVLEKQRRKSCVACRVSSFLPSIHPSTPLPFHSGSVEYWSQSQVSWDEGGRLNIWISCQYVSICTHYHTLGSFRGPISDFHYSQIQGAAKLGGEALVE